MRYRASATLEFPTAQPETVRTTIDARTHRKAASQAITALLKAHPGRRPSSIVVVLELDRTESEPE